MLAGALRRTRLWRGRSIFPLQYNSVPLSTFETLFVRVVDNTARIAFLHLVVIDRSRQRELRRCAAGFHLPGRARVLAMARSVAIVDLRRLEVRNVIISV